MGKKDKEDKPIIDKLGDILDKLSPDIRDLLASKETSRPKPRE